MAEVQAARGPRVLIAGGGIAGLETALALTDLGGGLAQITLLSPEPDFFFKPLTVEEPFTAEPAARHELAPALAEHGIGFVLSGLVGVEPERHLIRHGYDAELEYDLLAVCVGGRSRPAYEGIETFWSNRSDVPIDDLLRAAAESSSQTLALVVPPGTSWPLPLYELALMARRRSEELGLADVRLTVLSPEDAPLGVFGTVASGALAQLLEARRIGFEAERYVTQTTDGSLVSEPGDAPIEAGAVLALPRIVGPATPGLPADEEGFVPIDEHGCVVGLEDVYAAGDGTNFPVKQGGIATQQADAVARHIAARLGAPVQPRPFEPILRGQLLTGMESLHMKHQLTGGHGEGQASLDYLWWPPQKVAGRYLSAWLGHTEPADLEPPSSTLEVEASWPHEWHGTPMTPNLAPPDGG